ncbi:MAG: maleylacetoacetate isomerase [Alphaproteobacteria bacterium]|jgi:maleylacetoacetate isomerase|nr:maleylacetoacetate isomerase [Alphaproteobacteria bacterium]
MKLYDYAYSSAGYRARIALNLKGLAYDRSVINLIKDGGQQHSAAYKAINPHELIPALEVDGTTLGQSLAIIEYLDETYPVPPLLPSYPVEKARVRQIAYAIACDMHPINNQRVRQHLKALGHSDEEILSKWYSHWIAVGFAALETQLSTSKMTGAFCHGDTPTLADICLVPQMANAYRFKVPVDAFPTLVRIDKTCRALPAFAAAAPEKQPDAV